MVGKVPQHRVEDVKSAVNFLSTLRLQDTQWRRTKGSFRGRFRRLAGRRPVAQQRRQ